MKFICDNCKTKYQIADEKTAGKTVRMKCRKCGHAIEVRAAITETGGAASVGALAEGEVSVQAASVAPPAPARPSKPPPRPAPPRPPPRPRAASERPSGALANAFQMSVKRDEEVSASMDLAELSAADQWYVAIGGVPVGPVPIAEVRQRAASGAVTEDSLCWQEGLEEWRPVRAFPELAQIVREAAEISQGRPSHISTADSYMGHSPAPPPAAERVAPRPAAPPPRPPPRAPEPVRPFSQIEPLEDAGEDPTVAFSGALPGLHPAAAVAPDPFAASARAEPGPVSRVPLSNTTTIATRNKREIPWIIVGVVLSFVAFGVTVGVGVVLKMQTPAPVPALAVTPTQAPKPPPPVEPAAAPAALAVNPDVLTLDPVVVAPVARAAAAAPAKSVAPAPAAGLALDLKGLKTSQGVSVGEDPAGGPRAAGQCYAQSQVKQVASQHEVALRRACWERSTSARANANISVTWTIGTNGRVETISSTGDEPTVAHCIESNVRTWQFPPLGCSQTTAIQYHFVKE